MNLSILIAKKITVYEKKSFSLFISRIAILAIALSVSVMIIGSAITRGYQEHISQKFYDCWGHLNITNFSPDPSNMMSAEKILYDTNLVKQVKNTAHVTGVQPYSLQSCILKTNDGIEGIVLKGLNDTSSFKTVEQFLVEGKPITFRKDSFSNEIVVSKTMATRFNLKLNDRIILYFFSGLNDAPRARKVLIVGIFNTGLEEYDKSFSLCDYRFINHLNKDSNNLIQGYEITLDDIKNSRQVEKEIFTNYLQSPLEIYSLEKRFGNVFSWLEMMKMNEKIIIIIMMIIALINMISALLILILERTPMIGILKSLGMSNLKIQLIFLYSSFYIIGIGLFLGTSLGIGLCLLQQKFGLLRLDEATYFVNKIPIALHLENILFILFSTVIICFSILIFPSLIIRNVSPTKAINFK
jgi:lipoprotein-releasing system permease protein